MSTHAAEVFKAVQQAQIRQTKLNALRNPDLFVKVAVDRGYPCTADDWESSVESFSPDQVATLMNPGVGKRQRLVPR
jgi:Nif11 domain